MGLSLDEVNEKVYIADCWNRRVQVLSFQGEFLSHFGEEVLSLISTIFNKKYYLLLYKGTLKT